MEPTNEMLDDVLNVVGDTPPPIAPASAPSVATLLKIVAAGMSITDARMLLSSGYDADDVLAIAEKQAEAARERLDEANRARTVETAKAVEKATNPSNREHPGKSWMAYPEGDRARPRPAFRHDIWWNGYPQHKFQEELHWYEAELFQQLRPGNYKCMEKDGQTTHDVSVTAKRNASDVIERMDVTFAVLRELKERIPPLAVWLYQMTHADMHPRESFMKGMMEYLDTMYKDEQAKRLPLDQVAV